MLKAIRFSPLLLAVLLCTGLVVYLYMPQESTEVVRQGGETTVVAQQIALQEFEVAIEALGTAKANESVVITTQTSDIVHKIHFDDSDVVKQGQLLLELDNQEEKARLAALNVTLEEAKRQLKRITNLAKSNVASEQLLDEQQAKVKELSAQVLVAETQLAQLEVKAPFAGVLGVRQISQGALVRPGDQITTLDDIHTIKVDFEIAESHLSSLALGQLIRATSIAYPGEVFSGKIVSIGSRVDPNTRAIQIRATIDNQSLKLRPGMLLQIVLQKQVLQSLVIPEAALVPVENKQFVFVVNNQTASKVEVQVGRRKPGVVQILGGLEPGDLVVVQGALKIREGSKVKVLLEKGQG
ncbi:efflux RND transporter periplasmic adaptor subunit [Paraglaciecola aestuariivivens]